MGIRIPRTVATQSKAGSAVDLKDKKQVESRRLIM
ncbi:hypothetical protein ACK2FO_20725 [Clostridioides difficile]